MKLPSLIILLLLLLVIALLPSCGTAGFPLSGSLIYRDPDSGAKAGMIFSPGSAPRAMIKVPIYDSKTGKLVGMADLSADIPVRAEK